MRMLVFLASAVLFAHPAFAAVRGELIALKELSSSSRKSLDLSKRVSGASMLIPSKSAVTYFAFQYWTQGLHQEPVRASALLIVPTELSGPLPWISYQHGTIVEREAAPSRVEAS